MWQAHSFIMLSTVLHGHIGIMYFFGVRAAVIPLITDVLLLAGEI
jgi:hypothetical protein